MTICQTIVYQFTNYEKWYDMYISITCIDFFLLFIIKKTNVVKRSKESISKLSSTVVYHLTSHKKLDIWHIDKHVTFFETERANRIGHLSMFYINKSKKKSTKYKNNQKTIGVIREQEKAVNIYIYLYMQGRL